MKRHFIKKPVLASNDVDSRPTVEDVLDIIRSDNEFLVETTTDVYLCDPSAATHPGAYKVSLKDISEAISDAVDEWGNPTSEEVVSDFLYSYAKDVTARDLANAYQSAGKPVPDEFY